MPTLPEEKYATLEGPVRIGVLVPLTRPGWVEAGRHLLAGLDMAADELCFSLS